MTNTNDLLEVNDLSRYFPAPNARAGQRDAVIKAVDGLNFSIGKGKTVALVGESGCGKTTATRMVLRLDHPTRGTIRMEGRDINQLRGKDLKKFRADVQAVFQDPWSSLNPRMRVRDIVAEPLIATSSAKSAEVDERVAKVLTAVGLRPEQARNFPHEFSGGQRQRIAIASALISNPKLIVLDEPVSALDVSIRSQIMNLFKDIQDEVGVSYLLVAHDLATTRYLADTIAVMYLGRIVEYGPSEEIFSSPQHPYTQALFSAALPTEPTAHSEEIILEGEMPSPMDPPSGCPFHPRCHKKIGAICEDLRPEYKRASGQVFAACHLLDDRSTDGDNSVFSVEEG